MEGPNVTAGARHDGDWSFRCECWLALLVFVVGLSLTTHHPSCDDRPRPKLPEHHGDDGQIENKREEGAPHNETTPPQHYHRQGDGRGGQRQLRPPTLVGEISPGDSDEAYKRDEPEQPEDPLDCLPCAKYP